MRRWILAAVMIAAAVAAVPPVAGTRTADAVTDDDGRVTGGHSTACRSASAASSSR